MDDDEQNSVKGVGYVTSPKSRSPPLTSDMIIEKRYQNEEEPVNLKTTSFKLDNDHQTDNVDEASSPESENDLSSDDSHQECFENYIDTEDENLKRSRLSHANYYLSQQIGYLRRTLYPETIKRKMKSDAQD
ncbi:uncharacterized protein LOC127286134 [Leptopilina boulardi]|uniref:uncharacterized protein LOC127286134 n=1 Tax=Leptopilina boulardi TaxID=63433 RepID=UPI0021F598DD|nr:uncharacterized protein LOC127286134 [Leptopilina boulardi]